MEEPSMSKAVTSKPKATRGITVKIIRRSGQPGLVSVDRQVVDLKQVGQVVQDLQGNEAGEVEEGSTIVKVEDVNGLEDERQQDADDIRSQIAEMCHQLSDLGEECFLMSLRISDGTSHHVGSIKGDHFCLLRPEIVQDFHNFCFSIEDMRGEEEEDIQDISEDIEADNSQDNDTASILDDEQQELMDTENLADIQKSSPVKSKIRVKKKIDGTDSLLDHPYVTVIKEEQITAAPVEVKENNQSDISIRGLFVCDICKSNFSDIKKLRKHKLREHGDSNFECEKCSRVFSLKKALTRHLADAHAEGESHYFLCDTCVTKFESKEELYRHIKCNHNIEKPMKCDVCEQTFPDIQHLMEHRKIHFDYACFCDKCWQGFFDYLELETHIQSNCRYKEAFYKCDICGKRFFTLRKLGDHVIDTHTLDFLHVCKMCGRGFDSEKDLKHHRRIGHIIRPYKCELCDKTFKKKDSLLEHRRFHIRISYMLLNREKVMSANGSASMFVDVMEEDDDDFGDKSQFECDMCGIILNSQSLLEQHKHQHETATEQYKCDLCSKIFFTLDLLNNHCKKDHKILISPKITGANADMKETLKCEFKGCSKTFSNRAKLRQHLKYHQRHVNKHAGEKDMLKKKNKSYTCEVCGKVFKCKSYLKPHMLIHNKDHPYQCEVCGKGYPTPKRLEDHIRVHTGEKPFKCQVCDKRFSSTNFRYQHMMVHWGAKSFKCDVCGKDLKSRILFKDHMRIHDGEQPHKCDTCSKTFIYRRCLVRHMLVHTDFKKRAKPYKCKHCSKEYTDATGLKHHVRSKHTGETPFQCDKCGESFHRNDKLKRHVVTRHHVAKDNKERIVTTSHRSQGAQGVVKAWTKDQENLPQNGRVNEVKGSQNEVHLNIIQQGNNGLGKEGDEPTYGSRVIEAPDGTQYITADSGEDLQEREIDGRIKQQV